MERKGLIQISGWDTRHWIKWEVPRQQYAHQQGCEIRKWHGKVSKTVKCHLLHVLGLHPRARAYYIKMGGGGDKQNRFRSPQIKPSSSSPPPLLPFKFLNHHSCSLELIWSSNLDSLKTCHEEVKRRDKEKTRTKKNHPPQQQQKSQK